MKTLIKSTWRNRQYNLLALEGKYNGFILASLSIIPHTGCWTLWDIRLTKHRLPCKYSDLSNLEEHFIDSDDELNFFTSKLSVYEYDPVNKKLIWNTMDGTVKGHENINGFKPAWDSKVSAEGGYFSKKEGLEKLKEIQHYWLDKPDFANEYRLPNLHSKPSSFNLSFDYRFPQLTAVS